MKEKNKHILEKAFAQLPQFKADDRIWDKLEQKLDSETQEIKREVLKKALEQLCNRDGVEYRFDNIDWDGRNQSLMWGGRVFEVLKEYK